MPCLSAARGEKWHGSSKPLMPRFGLAGAALAQVIAAGVALSLTLAPTWDIFRQTFNLYWLPRVAMAFGVVALLAKTFSTGDLTFMSAVIEYHQSDGKDRADLTAWDSADLAAEHP